MGTKFPVVASLVFGSIVVLATATVTTAQQYVFDTSHTAIVFQIDHLGMSHTYGRFNEITGEFTVDSQNAAGSSFSLTIQTNSVDTGFEKRDDHLRGPDFFNAKQFPVISFKSTKVEVDTHGYRLTGDLSLHGVTKSITFNLRKMGEGIDPWGNYRMGFSTELNIKRSDFGMDHMLEAVGDDVRLMISFEGLRQ